LLAFEFIFSAGYGVLYQSTIRQHLTLDITVHKFVSCGFFFSWYKGAGA
jgi:hypothetical protein